jgi:hypothetical protein
LDCKFWVVHVSYALSAANKTLNYTIVSLTERGGIIGFYCRLLLPYFESLSVAIAPIIVVCIIGVLISIVVSTEVVLMEKGKEM